MAERESIDTLAAEYVLGTLDGAERETVAERRLLDAELDAAISAWELRLAPLDQLTEEVTPPPELLTRIESRIAGKPPVTTQKAVAAELESNSKTSNGSVPAITL